MACASCSMLLHVDFGANKSSGIMNSSSISVARQTHRPILMHGVQNQPILSLRGTSVHFRLRKIEAIRLHPSSVPYRSGFLSKKLAIERTLSFGQISAGHNRRHLSLVHAFHNSDDYDAIGSAHGDDFLFVASDDDGEIGVSAPRDVEILNSEGVPASLTVEEIEVPGLFKSEEPNYFIDTAQSETDVGQTGVRPSPELVSLAKSIVLPLSGVSKKEDAMIQTSPSDNNKKLWWNPLQFLNSSSPSASVALKKKIAEGLRRAEDDFFAFSSQLGKYMFIMSATGAILATGFQLSGGEAHQEGVLWFSWLAGVVIGSMIGAGQVLEGHARRGRRNVVITGSTRGLGKALAREFLRAGDNVVVASRSLNSVSSTVLELQQEVNEKRNSLLLGEDKQVQALEMQVSKKGSKVVGMPCDVSKSEDVQALAEMALHEFGTIDIWINNAGMNKGFRPLVEFSDEEISEIVSTNLTGSLICTREAIRVMKKQPKGGHIFNMDGAGSGGTSTPLTAVYGATKCGLRQLSASLLQECKGSRVGIHTASPGMVLTDLLLSGASLQNKQMFNIICEQPETVAQALVPYLRTVKGTGKAVNYLTPPRIILAIVNAWFRRGRWFDEEGRAVYAAEADRLRLWAEGHEKSPVTAAMEMVPSGAWVSLFSSSVLCAYVIISNLTAGGSSGT